MNRCKHLQTKKYFKNSYYILVHPLSTEWNHPMGESHNKYINALKVLQKKAIRIIDNASYNSHTNSL